MGQIEPQLAGKAVKQREANASLEAWLAGTAKIDPRRMWMGHQLYFPSSSSQKTSVFVIPDLAPPFFISLLSEQLQMFGHDLDERSPCYSGEGKSPADVLHDFSIYLQNSRC